MRASNGASESKTRAVDDSLCAALAMMRKAYAFANDAGAQLWDFALEINHLYEVGLTISDIRWLVAKGLVEHGVETSVYGDEHRSFRKTSGYNFANSTCLILTAHGKQLADQVLNNSSEPSCFTIDSGMPDEAEEPRLSAHSPVGEVEISSVLKPRWYFQRRELWLADTIVKRFQVPARNQQAILCAFEEEGWPDHIDDPLPVNVSIDPRTRLHDTINRLNGCQSHPLLRFHGNGHGTGVRWELRRSMNQAMRD